MMEETHMPEATLHDGSTIEIEVDGAGPILLLPVNPQPVIGPQAEQMRKYGTDPALGQSLIKGLSDAFRVVAFDYEGQCLRRPKPDTLTPANTANDLLAVADAAGADRFAYYGYSWLAMIGLQLAIRGDAPRHDRGLRDGERRADNGADGGIRVVWHGSVKGSDPAICHAVPGAARIRRPSRSSADHLSSSLLCGFGG